MKTLSSVAPRSGEIAVIGMSCRFPKSASYTEFWDRLLKEEETISFFEKKEESGHFVNAKPFIENSDCFDPEFFKISSREASLMDPQHRLLLQCAWHAFEDAGYLPQEIKGRVGVFAASNFNTYQHINGWFSQYWRENRDKPSARFLAYTGNIQDTLATRISYKLNLKGPSLTVQTACSSSLVALHLACQSLLLQESDLALVGASALTFPDKEGYYYEPSMILSEDGHCYAFDQKANGTVFGNGVSCVLLKPLEQAIADNDHIYGVIKGSAINNDGSQKVDFNAPSVLGQKEVIEQAHQVSGVSPESIAYIEAHATGTIVGDPIEFEALCQAYRTGTKKKRFCGIGAVKNNIGHLDAASGMAGLLKVLLALDQEVIPATIHCEKPNEHLKLSSSPFYLITKKKSFKRGSELRRCGLTSLGIGGTNAHVILEEAPSLKKKTVQKKNIEGPFPFLLSADTPEQLKLYLEAILAHIQKNSKHLNILDLAFTLAVSRVRKKNRCVGFFSHLEELERALLQHLEGGSSSFFIFDSSKSMNKEALHHYLAGFSAELKAYVQEWLNEKKIESHSFFLHLGAKRVPLPGYPFKQKRYWFDQVDGLLSSSIWRQSSAEDGSQVFSKQLDLTEPWIRDHVIEGRMILPATGYVFIARQICENLKIQGPITFKSFSFIRPVFAEKAFVSLDVRHDLQQNPAHLTIQHQGVIASECYIEQTVKQKERRSFKELLEGATSVPLNSIYSAYEKQGISYGPTFQCLKKLFLGKQGEVIGEIEVSHLSEELLPQAMDAAFQTALGLPYLREAHHLATDGFIPVSIESISLVSPLESKMFAVLSPRSLESELASHFINYDVAVYSLDGSPIFFFEGVKEKKIISKVKSPSLALSARENVLHLEDTREKTFISWFAKATGNEEAFVDLDASLEKYNIDSILAIALTEQISKRFGSVSKTVFFEHRNLREVLRSIVFKEENEERYSLPQIEVASEKKDSLEKEPIAIVGLSGYYPFSKNLEELWTNLVQGKNLITEIPPDRWDHSLYFSKEKGVIGKTYSKWGGFLSNVDFFDALFFKISPREAALLDPQERLFLQIAWSTLEDAGYTPQFLNRRTAHSVGVYVGAMYQEYQLYGIEERLKNNPVILNGIMSTIANRVSYYCDFRGPSFAVDTMCSSSLTALYLACQDLANGNVKAALVGGVNVTVHPNKYLQLAQERMLADDGLCKSFGPEGTGYVPSEGIGCVLLKPLSLAEQDHDHIYGMIRGVEINHGGKTNGFTVPNAHAQAEVIRKTLQRSGVHSSEISYVEAHGTGTALGDPIEIRGLSEVFEKGTLQKCAIGSIKSNLGHTESAAGIAGLTKVLLQLKHRTLVPSIHSEELNPNIDFSKSPFRVQRNVEEWKSVNGSRIAALSSFGAGGSNAHVIIQEYIPILSSAAQLDRLIVLSARNQERLATYARSFVEFIEKGHLNGASLADVAFTLSVGREAMSCRAAFICSSQKEFLDLMRVIADQGSHEKLHYKEVLQEMSAQQGVLDLALQQKDLSSLRSLWLQGAVIEWDKLYKAENPHPNRLSLPTYPFEEKKCRFIQAPVNSFLEARSLHPLVHENITGLEEVRFRTIVTNRMGLIQDHKIGQQVIYPGAAYIEMVLFICKHTLQKSTPLRLKTFSFLKPLYVNDAPKELYTSFVAHHNLFKVELWGNEEGKEQIFCQAITGENPERSKDKFPEFSGREGVSYFDQEAVYRKFREFKFEYGPAYQRIQKIAVHQNEALVEVRLESGETPDLFTVHPILLDAAFQSSIAFDLNDPADYTYVPQEIQDLSVYKQLSSSIFIYVLKLNSPDTSSRYYKISIWNDQKELCVEIKRFKETILLQAAREDRSLLYAIPTWVKKSSFARSALNKAERYLLTTQEIASENGERGQEKLMILEESPGKIMSNVLSLVEVTKRLFQQKNDRPVSFLLLMHEKEAWKVAPFVGFFKALAIENFRYFGKVVLLPEKKQDSQQMAQLLESEWESGDHFVQYDSLGNRFVESYSSLKDLSVSHETPFVRSDGVYLFVGGSGGVGKQCVRLFVAKNISCTIILIGRRPSAENSFASWGSNRVSVRYLSCEVTDEKMVSETVNKVMTEYGTITGVFYLAGITSDSLLIRKSIDDFKRVLSPKIEGILQFDRALAKCPLEYLLLFSSDSSAFGNIGQTDYCAANAFLDGFARYREELRKQGERSGLTKVINWPFWKEGGMTLEQAVIDRLYADQGVVPLETEVAYKALEAIFRSAEIRVVPLQGNAEKIKSSINQVFQAEEVLKSKEVKVNLEERKRISDLLKTVLVNELKIESHLMKDETEFSDFGVDSILSMNIISNLEKTFGNLPKTLFFEYPTFSSLLGYFLENHASVLRSSSISSSELNLSSKAAYSSPRVTSIQSIREQKKTARPSLSADIAIIGVAGRYPQADTLEELWENLVAGKNCIQEIPLDRFDYTAIFERNTNQIGKTKSKWGGFLKNVHAFDPLFFKISKDEAERLDPQERLFLQTAWHTIEDAAYTRERLQLKANGEVGVYVGSMYQEYQLFNGEQALLNNPVMLGGSAASIANRVSYFLNLKGPSLTLDTMCSSAITAMYLACQDLIRGKCKMAIAGGVNVSVHPNKYQVLSYENFLSSDGLCKSFGAGGDGYVPSEGVGAVLLKPLSQAMIDRDAIYGVIRGIDVNHGGKANGFTVPNANAQAAVIRSTIEQSCLAADQISYVEAHGTGTSLGDPIEISGLSQAFSSFPITSKKALGSIKSNIGHCESAAGMASLTKVLLQMKHRTLVPSIHGDPPNPHIPFEQVPFSLQKTLSTWESKKRTALISSFGAGGSNGAIVIEEYQNTLRATPIENEKLSRLFLLSAQQADRLREYAAQFLQFFQKQDEKTFSISDCVYTLQMGRESFKERLAIPFENFSDLKEQLAFYVNKSPSPRIFESKESSLLDKIEVAGIKDDFHAFLSAHLSAYPIDTLAKLWVSGVNVDWVSLYSNDFCRVMSLPGYPFAQIHCSFKKVAAMTFSQTQAKIHPFLDSNTSDFYQHRFTTVFEQQESIIKDHVIQGKNVLPGALIAEMFVAGAAILSKDQPYQLEELIWLRPLELNEGRTVAHTVLSLDRERGISAQLLNHSSEILSQARLLPQQMNQEPLFFDLAKIQTKMSRRMNREKVYELFNQIGFSFGPSFKTLGEIVASEIEFLAQVTLPSEALKYAECKIQPYLLDAMLQSTIVFAKDDELTLPFAIQKLQWLSAIRTPTWIYGKQIAKKENGESTYDLFALNENGQACLAVYGFQDAIFSPVRSKLKNSKQEPIDDLLSLFLQNNLSLDETETALTLLLR
jgi:acyl transferase domain-containing protein/NADP-dependent 3-hydroxy acid dehydrogenase YdfG/acyl carrier protein